MITPESLSRAIDMQRLNIAAERGEVEPIQLAEVAGAIGVHPSALSRIRGDQMPSKPTLAKILTWLDDEKSAHCTSCEEEAQASHEAGDVDIDAEFERLVGGDLEDEAPVDEEEKTDEVKEGLVKAVFATGRLSESDDPDTQAIVNRAKELLKEGAVGVSVALDLHPDDVEAIAEAEKVANEDEWSKPFDEYLPEGFVPRHRIRHTAIVGTPAYADARLELRDDGTVAGVVTFQGEYTGDMRYFESVDLDSSRVPSPILFNRELEGHEGPTIGYIDKFEWVERPPSSHRARLDDEAITASLKPMTFPAAYFAQSVPTGPEPIRISAPDEKGYRAIRGLAAPKGVCHRSNMQCWTWPGDPDPKHRHFHTGTLIGLDNGQDIRVGALTFGGPHLNPELARQGVTASQVGSHREDSNKVLALVRVWETRLGLMCAGVIPPDVPESSILRALACSPSIEFWPENGKRHLVGLHMVPTPALPVIASVGSAELVVTDERVEVEDKEDLEASLVDGDESEPGGKQVSMGELTVKLDASDIELDTSDLAGKLDAVHEEMHALRAQLDEIGSAVKTILALTPLDDVIIPE